VTVRSLPLLFVVMPLLLFSGHCQPSVPLGDDDTYRLACDLADRTEEIYDRILANKPYEPSLMAWGMQYLARGYVDLYAVTGDRAWLDRAINITDFFLLYSDVNRDDNPCWGNYNETFGNARFGWKEYTVWDGVISFPMVLVASVIRSDANLSRDQALLSKADRYVELVEKVVRYHWPAWTQIGPDQGYYWDDTSGDVGPYVNGFAALGRTELLLADLTGNQSYLERPKQMVNYLLAHMHYEPTDDLYTWGYEIGSGPAEDISHGAIDLEFLLLAYEKGLVPEEDLKRICRTYERRIWQVPRILLKGYPLAMRVDGSGDEDYTSYSRSWILLSSLVPSIYEKQRVALGIWNRRYGLYPAGWNVLALAQILLQHDRLEAIGVNPEGLVALSKGQVYSILANASLRLERAASLGANVTLERSLLETAAKLLEGGSARNVSIPIALAWEAWDRLERTIEVGGRLDGLRARLDEATALGANVTGVSENYTRLERDFGRLDSSSMDSLDERIRALSQELERVTVEFFIREAQTAVERAKGMGVDTSRHEIFLRRAREEFDKGNYGSAREFTKYPLSLREAAPEPLALLSFLLLLVTATWCRFSCDLARVGWRGASG